MRSRRAFIISVAATLAVPGVGAQAVRWSTDSAVGTIASLQQGLIAAARSASIDERYRALVPLITATHALPYIAEFSLRRQWSSLAEADRQRFLVAFERLSVMTYAARFKSVGADTFRPINSEPADSSGRIKVQTAVARADQPDVSLEYVLQQDAQGWRIINVVADGVSDLALKRAEYQRVFMNGGIEGLIAELEQQTARLEGG